MKLLDFILGVIYNLLALAVLGGVFILCNMIAYKAVMIVFR